MTRITRHQQRIIALQVLYSLDIRKQLQPENILIELENLKKNEDAVELERGQYFYQIIEGVVESRPQLDKIIEKLAIDWEIERISPVIRNILRIALWEIKEQTPPGIAINEAVELAREFENKKAAAFVNGVLGKSLELLGIT